MIAARKTTDRVRAEEAKDQVTALLSRGLDKRYFTNPDAAGGILLSRRDCARSFSSHTE